ncbi:class I SAM-dependent methyltransferase [bacterium]|nr:class I SAM-dependent methyltransferase [candidate division CSSED10-310 bacterium]
MWEAGQSEFDSVDHGQAVDFSTRIDGYEKWYLSGKGRRYELLERSMLLRMLPRLGACNVLEIGCGTGWWSTIMAGCGHIVTSIDISPAMIAAAVAKDVPKTRFVIADARELPFASGAFDCVVAVTALEFTGDPRRTIREMVRCVDRRHGRIVILALDGSSAINRRRMARLDDVYRRGRLPAAAELRDWLSPHGHTEMHRCAYPLSLRLPCCLAGPVDRLQGNLRIRGNAVLAAVTRISR